MIKLWEVFYWNKHRYEWLPLGMAEGRDRYFAIRDAKVTFRDAIARGDILKVEEYSGK